jgi:trimeric autotransporter adhesin
MKKSIRTLGIFAVSAGTALLATDTFAYTCTFTNPASCSNITGANEATVAGGYSNEANGAASTVSGGLDNTAGGDYSVVGGGYDSVAGGAYSIVAGGDANNNYGNTATICGGATNNIGSAESYSFIGGGINNSIGVSAANPGASSAITGGDENIVDAGSSYMFIGGGSSNHIINNTSSDSPNFSSSVICGGYDNRLDSSGTFSGGEYSVIGGGIQNYASGAFSVIAGGYDNQATASQGAAVLGGIGNVASGIQASVLGGYGNTAAGAESVAAGYYANAAHDGCMVFSDSTTTTPGASCSAANQFVVKASGGIFLFSDTGSTSGQFQSAGGHMWNSVSDRNQKNSFQAVDTRDVLERLVSIPVTTWKYNTEESGATHMGVMAQDFHAQFGLGDFDTHIGTLDADGVQVAAIQGLYSMVSAQEAEIDSAHAENAKLRSEMGALEARLARLEAAIGQQ